MRECIGMRACAGVGLRRGAEARQSHAVKAHAHKPPPERPNAPKGRAARARPSGGDPTSSFTCGVDVMDILMHHHRNSRVHSWRVRCSPCFPLTDSYPVGSSTHSHPPWPTAGLSGIGMSCIPIGIPRPELMTAGRPRSASDCNLE